MRFGFYISKKNYLSLLLATTTTAIFRWFIFTLSILGLVCLEINGLKHRLNRILIKFFFVGNDLPFLCICKNEVVCTTNLDEELRRCCVRVYVCVCVCVRIESYRSLSSIGLYVWLENIANSRALLYYRSQSSFEIERKKLSFNNWKISSFEATKKRSCSI